MEADLADHHISGVYTKMLMELLLDTMPADRIEEMLRTAGETRGLGELTSWPALFRDRSADIPRASYALRAVTSQ
jgi:hypothetical protein